MKTGLRLLALTLVLTMNSGVVSVNAADTNGNITRGEFVQMLWESNGKPEPEASNPFRDVPPNISAAIASLYENGVVSGYGGGVFAPGDVLTTEMAYVMLLRNFRLTPYNADEYRNYPDDDMVSEWAGAAVSYMYESVINEADTPIDSKSGMTRAEAAALITRLNNIATLDVAIKEIINRPEFSGALWGMEFSVAGASENIISLNREQFYQPASSLKIFTAGTVFEALGADYLFHTPIYRTGSIVDGVLKGDLVLVGSGDMLLGGRINPDGTINLPETDHTYGTSATAVPVSDSPLASLYDFAEQIAANGIESIEGNIIIDDSLFPLANDNLGGTGDYSISPIMINDNLIDILITPGEKEGDPAAIKVMPETPYVTFINEVTTVAPAGNLSPGMMVRKPGFESDTMNPDGTRTVTVTGSVASDTEPVLSVYCIPDPARFVESALAMVLEEKGISANVDLLEEYDFDALSTHYTEENKVAELISPPLAMELMPMMKLSSNMHTAAWPHVVGAIVTGESEHARMRGFEIQAEMYERIGVEINVPLEDIQNVSSIRYAPKSYTNYLNYLTEQAWFDEYITILPILGVDGTLGAVEPGSAAAGNVFAKTGGGMNSRMVDGERQAYIVSALAGFMILPDDQIVTFSIFTDYETSSPSMNPARSAINDIVSAVYEHMISD